MKKIFTLKNIAAIGVFTAVATLLYCIPGLQFSIPLAPPFMKIHFDEVACLIAGLAYNPVVGVMVLLLKYLIKLPMDAANLWIGVLADFIYGLALVLPASLIYHKWRSLKGAVVSIVVGFASSVIVSSFLGLYIIFPIYGWALGEQAVIGMFQVLDPKISSVTDFRIAYEILLPFNLIKNVFVCVVTFLIYKPISDFIEKRVKIKD